MSMFTQQGQGIRVARSSCPEAAGGQDECPFQGSLRWLPVRRLIGQRQGPWGWGAGVFDLTARRVLIFPSIPLGRGSSELGDPFVLCYQSFSIHHTEASHSPVCRQAGV